MPVRERWAAAVRATAHAAVRVHQTCEGFVGPDAGSRNPNGPTTDATCAAVCRACTVVDRCEPGHPGPDVVFDAVAGPALRPPKRRTTPWRR